MSTNKRVKETFDKFGKDLVITKQSCDTKKMLEYIKNKVEIKKAVGEIIDTLIEDSLMIDAWWTDLNDEQEQEVYGKLEEIITRRFGNIKNYQYICNMTKEEADELNLESAKDNGNKFAFPIDKNK